MDGQRPEREEAIRGWLRRFGDAPPVLARELADHLVAALAAAGAQPAGPAAAGAESAALDDARALGVLRAQQGHPVESLLEDALTLRALLGGRPEAPPGPLTRLIDLIAVAAAAAYTDELTLILTARATRDPLTGLANRAAFSEVMGHELAGKARTAPPSLLLVDLDRFKQVNDTAGHLAGDAVLTAVARVLEGAVREMDVPVRLGGDEFAVILPRTGPGQAARIARRLLAAARAAPGLQAGRTRVTLSVGVGWLPDPRTDDELVAAADAALYRAKAAGGDRMHESRAPAANGTR